MKFVADLHLHSKYSRAVSGAMTLPNMAKWAKYKGINVLTTGDFTHPFWFEQLKNELEEVGNGLYKLRVNSSQFTEKNSEPLTVNHEPIYFLLSCEISSIYSQGGKGRRIHNLFFFPSLTAVEKFNLELLKRRCNLRADGRPIVGISSRDLVQIALSCDEKALVVPAHAWTPWFSVFGSFSGFDSIEECFQDMSQYIFGIETGLSSDPAMNWQIEDLDNRSILSFSDAHSLEKMGREATVFEGNEVSFDCIYDAIRQVGKLAGGQEGPKPTNPQAHEPINHPKIAFTIEFYPEEGKYHFTGHRDCNFSQGPNSAEQNCPVCKRPLTVGVMDRVEQLKSQNSKVKTVEKDTVKWVYPDGDNRPPYVSMVPLGEILAEVFEVSVGTKKVVDSYQLLVNNLGSEFSVLIRADLDQIRRLSGDRVAEAISKVRARDIVVDPGYDGKFGVVKIWSQHEDQVKDIQVEESQLNLFASGYD